MVVKVLQVGEVLKCADTCRCIAGPQWADRGSWWARAGAIGVLRQDPDLGGGLDGPERALADQLTAEVLTVEPGSRRFGAEPAHISGHLGFLVLDGLLARRVLIAQTRCTELLGQGDLLRPWSMDAAEISSVPVETDWRIVGGPARFAVPDAHFARHAARWPQIL